MAANRVLPFLADRGSLSLNGSCSYHDSAAGLAPAFVRGAACRRRSIGPARRLSHARSRRIERDLPHRAERHEFASRPQRGDMRGLHGVVVSGGTQPRRATDPRWRAGAARVRACMRRAAKRSTTPPQFLPSTAQRSLKQSFRSCFNILWEAHVHSTINDSACAVRAAGSCKGAGPRAKIETGFDSSRR